MELDEVVSVEFYFMGTETEGLLALERWHLERDPAPEFYWEELR